MFHMKRLVDSMGSEQGPVKIRLSPGKNANPSKPAAHQKLNNVKKK